MVDGYRMFRIAYWTGMLFSLAWLLFTVLFAFRSVRLEPLGLLVIALSHMAVIITLGLVRVPLETRVLAGNQIQTAGYLHTLIGFSVILTLLGISGSFSPSLVLAPLGSALITSILGWLVGGEMVGRSLETDEDVVRSEAERVAGELRGFAHAVRAAHEDYIRSIRELVDGHTTLNEQQKRVISRVVSATDEISSSISRVPGAIVSLGDAVGKAGEELDRHLGEDFMRLIGSLGSRVKAVNSALETVALNSRDAEKYLRESRVLIEELERLLAYVTSYESRS